MAVAFPSRLVTHCVRSVPAGTVYGPNETVNAPGGGSKLPPAPPEPLAAVDDVLLVAFDVAPPLPPSVEWVEQPRSPAQRRRGEAKVERISGS